MIPGEVAEVTLEQPFPKTPNTGYNASREMERSLLPAHIFNYCQRETRWPAASTYVTIHARILSSSHGHPSCASEQDHMPGSSHSDPSE